MKTPDLLKKLNVDKIDGLLLDLGVSSPQLDIAERGFSFMRNGPLDMRMDTTQEVTAQKLLETLSDKELESIINDFGEERYYRKIVRAIRKAQAINPISTTHQLSEILSGTLYSKRPAKIHPATRTFQALRIAVNSELMHLKTALQNSLGVLGAGARLVTDSVSFAGRSNCEKFFPLRGEKLRLSASYSGLCLWQKTHPQSPDETSACRRRKRSGRKPPFIKRENAGGREGLCLSG